MEFPSPCEQQQSDFKCVRGSVQIFFFLSTNVPCTEPQQSCFLSGASSRQDFSTSASPEWQNFKSWLYSGVITSNFPILWPLVHYETQGFSLCSFHLHESCQNSGFVFFFVFNTNCDSLLSFFFFHSSTIQLSCSVSKCL